MAISKSNISAIISMCLGTLILQSCKKDKCMPITSSFSEEWRMVPETSTINIGDTVYFESILPVVPTNSNNQVASDALIGTAFSIRTIIGTNDLRDALDSFKVFPIKGSIVPNVIAPKKVYDVSWVKVGDNFVLKLLIIATYKGDYLFTLSDAIGNYGKGRSCTFSFDVRLTNSNINKNLQLLSPYYGGGTIPSSDSLHSFCIKVV